MQVFVLGIWAILSALSLLKIFEFVALNFRNLIFSFKATFLSLSQSVDFLFA